MLLLALLWSGSTVEVLAEFRDIYVGDIITLEISTFKYPLEELREMFQPFEIVDAKSKSYGYLLSIRTFEVGEQTILIDNNEIVIQVNSTLNSLERDDIFGVETRIYEPDFFFHWNILFFVFAGAFAVSGCLLLLKLVIAREKPAPSPSQLFLQRSSSLSSDDDNFFVDLTFYFKTYLESRYVCRIKVIGKTSAEIASELKDLPIPLALLPEISEWLIECDRLKFTGVSISNEKKQEHYDRLLSLIKKLDTHCGEAA
jgi:molybdopterin converting factor small subunit